MEMGQLGVRLSVKEKFFTKRVVRDWDRLPAEVVTALSLLNSRCVWTALSDI